MSPQITRRPAEHAVAVLNDVYRYRLTRTWDQALPRALWVMLNPSTADALVDDPTIRRVRSFTIAAGCGGFEVVNLFALRATNPWALFAAQDPVGPDNTMHIHAAVAQTNGPIIVAWGAHPAARGALQGGLSVAETTIEMLPQERLRCLGRNVHGSPRHPLYVSATQSLVPFIP
jgi:hypothetical protein